MFYMWFTAGLVIIALVAFIMAIFNRPLEEKSANKPLEASKGTKKGKKASGKAR